MSAVEEEKSERLETLYGWDSPYEEFDWEAHGGYPPASSYAPQRGYNAALGLLFFTAAFA